MMSQREDRLSLMLRRLCRSLANPRELPDRQLLERFLLFREETAFELLVRRHGPLVLGVCRRVLGNDHDAEDAFQATFLLLARKAGAIQRRESVGSWLYGVAYHMAQKLRTQAARRRKNEGAAPISQLFQATAESELEAALDAELQRLPAKYRIPIILCYFEGMTHAEVAVELGWPVGTVAGRLSRAREMLRERLVHRGVAMTVAGLATALGAQSASAAPLPLVQTTVQTALAVTAGKAAAGVASAQVIALTEGMVRTMLLTKVQNVLAATLVIGLLSSGVGVGTYQVLAQDRGDSSNGVALSAQPEATRAADNAPLGEPVRRIELVQTLRGHTDEVHSVAFSPDGRRLTSAGADGTVRVWDAETGKEIRALHSDKQAIWSLAVSPDGKLLAAGAAEGTLRLWELSSGQEIRVLRGADKPMRSVAFSPDGQLLVSASEDRTVRLWDAATGQEVRRLDVKDAGAERASAAVAFAPDGRTLAAAVADKSVSLLQVPDLRIRARYERNTERIDALAFTPDGKVLATGSADKTVHLLDVATGKELRRIVGHSDAVLSVAFSPDGNLLATASADGTVKLWDAATGKEVATLKIQNQRAVWSVTFAPNGKRVVTADANRAVQIWSVEGVIVRGENSDVAKDRVNWESRTLKAAADGDSIDRLILELVRGQKSNDQIIDAVFLATLGRFPLDTERKLTTDHLTKAKDRGEGTADIVWALTNSIEFKSHVEELNKRLKPSQ
jgi:RNA polymerase sigma factor (sigma-70 family)